MIVALKAHQVAAIADRMAPLLGPETVVVMAVNGVPWWYFYGIEGAVARSIMNEAEALAAKLASPC